MKLDAKAWVDAPEEILPVAQGAEGLGFAGLWVSETRHDPYILLAAAASGSERLALGTAIALAYPRSPMVTAYSAWDLQRLSGGRLILGLGSQVRAHIERRYSTPWDAPASRMKDYVQALRAIWRCWQEGGSLDYQGRFYRMNLMAPMWNPGPIQHPDIPVYLAAVGPGMLRVAGAVADGVHVHPLHTVRYVREGVLPYVAEGAQHAGRDSREVKLATMAFVVTGRDQAEMEASRKRVCQQIAFYASTPAYRAAVLERHGWEEVGRRLSQLAREGRWQEMGPLVPEEMLRAVAVVGEWDEVGPLLREKYGGLLARVAPYVDYRPGEKDEFWRVLLRSMGDA